MRREEFFEVLGGLEDDIVQEAKTPARKAAKWRGLRTAAIAAALTALLAVPAAAYTVETVRFNAAVHYLTGLGIDVEDLSDYSRREVITACEVYDADAGEDNELLERLLPESPPPSRPTEPSDVTSEQILALTPTMTVGDVAGLLGDTQDIGSGICILLYRVDGTHLLRIPFAGSDAQLGVRGEDLLKALEPVEQP